MLSVIIITKNESAMIERCLQSVNWADEIIVLDSGSEDNTVEICRRYTEKVFQTDWRGFGVQKQRALSLANGNWILSIDADEYVTTELKTEIQQAIIHNSQINGFYIPRLSSYCGQNIYHSGWHPDYVLRLFKRQQGYFSNDIIHERVIIQGNTAKLKRPLKHESMVDLTDVLNKINQYSSLSAKKLYDQGKTTSFTNLLLRTCWTFIRIYFFRAGFLDGRYGLMLAFSAAETTYYKYLKLLELSQSNSKIPKN
ncbi:MAG: hypothetical protein RL637_1820 [Pseudomonadota bacterium]|jgi:glycosyltransferase involved in cell wall biosynthesis